MRVHPLRLSQSRMHAEPLLAERLPAGKLLSTSAADQDEMIWAASPPPPPPFLPMHRILPTFTCTICDSMWEGWTSRLVRTEVSAVCSHAFCRQCISAWLRSQMNDGHLMLKCPSAGCQHLLSDPELRKFLGSAEMQTLEARRLNAALAVIPGFVWCPQCDKYGGIATSGCTLVTCDVCHYDFCHRCKVPHPDSCEAYQNAMSDDAKRHQYEDALSEACKKKHSKNCPSCTTPIQRSSGCSHITCTRCRYEFCWICLKKYSGRYVTGEVTVCTCD